MTDNPSVRLLPIALLLVLGAMWGGVTNIAKFVGQQGMPALMYTALTTSLAAVLMTVGSLLRRQSVPVSAPHLLFYLVSGVLATGLPTTVVFITVAHVSVGVMSAVLAMVPVFTYLLAILFRQEMYEPIRALGIAIGMAGALLILLTQTGTPVSAPWWWVCFGFISPISYAIANVFNHAYRPRHVGSFAIANGMLVGAALFLLLMVALTYSWSNLLSYDPSVISLTLVHGCISALAFTLLFVLLRIAGPVYFSQVAYLVTLFGIGFGMLIFSERFNHWFWLSLLTIFAGIVLVNRKRESG